MKKVIIILVSIALIIFGSAAFAQEFSYRQTPDHVGNQLMSQVAYNKTQVIQFAEKALQKKQAIDQNRIRIKELQRQLNVQIKQSKDSVKVMRSNPDSVGADQVNTIKEIVNRTASIKKTLAATDGLLKKKGAELRQARLQRKPAAFIRTLDEIIIIQKKRIEAMEEMITILERLNKTLG
ncbi:MAG: hypothetical protein ACOY46_08635 [Bacillota bacterium]